MDSFSTYFFTNFTKHTHHVFFFIGVNLTLLLTAMAFKFVLGDTLPPTPYLTTMEKYVLFTFVLLFAQGVCFWGLSDMYVYRW